MTVGSILETADGVRLLVVEIDKDQTVLLQRLRRDGTPYKGGRGRTRYTSNMLREALANGRLGSVI